MKLRRHPLAWGITSWGPLPGTEDLHVMWDGPGSGLFLAKGDPGAVELRKPIRHPSASGTYQTLREAEKAASAFAAAGDG